jgi:hypothetical protein
MDGITYADLIEFALDYLGGTPDSQALRDCRRSVLQAYRDLANAHPWSYLLTHGRVATRPPYMTGTIAYDHVGGAYDREVLLSGGTWPDWAGLGTHLRIGDVTYAVDERRGDTSITLLADLNPGADVDLGRTTIAGLALAAPIVVTSVGHGMTVATVATVIVEGVASSVDGGITSANGTWTVAVLDDDTFELVGSDGTGDDPWDATTGTWRPVPTTQFELIRDVYVLPADYVAGGTGLYEGNFGGLEFSDATSWLDDQRYTSSSGTPRRYAITGDARFPGRLVLRLSPYPDVAKTLDFIYARRPRALRVEAYDVGVATVATVAPAVVVGTGVAWTPAMAGATIRLGTARTLPTSWIGASPPAAEGRILEVVSATEMRVETAFAAGFEEVRYSISDPVDVERGAMLNALYRGIEMHLHIARSIKEKPDAFAAHDMALRVAKAADSRSLQGRSMGGYSGRQVLKKDMPADFS